MENILKQRLKRLFVMALVCAMITSLVGCSSGNGGSADKSTDGGDGSTAEAVEEADATTMQISKYVGGVTLTEGGVSTALRENMHLHNDNALKTEANGSVDILLDDTKMAGLDINSLASFTQAGKKLTAHIAEGAYRQ